MDQEETPQQEQLVKSFWTIRRILLCIIISVNLVAVTIAGADRSWVAFSIGMIYVPAINGFLMLLSLLTITIVRENGESGWLHFAFSLGVPLTATLLARLLISSFGLHGC